MSKKNALYALLRVITSNTKNKFKKLQTLIARVGKNISILHLTSKFINLVNILYKYISISNYK